MNRESLRKVGKIKASHGIKGEVFMLIFSKEASWVSTEVKIYLAKNETDFKMFKLNRVKPHKEGVIATIDGITTRNDSDLLIGQQIWVEKTVFTSKNQQSLYLIEIEDFEIVDETAGSIGFIKGFSSNGAQDLLIVEDNDQDYEIPFVKEFIVSIDHAQKIVNTKLPEGLLEINSTSESPDDGVDDEN